MNVLEVEHLTKDYGSGRGVFDVSFAVKEGEVFGFLGPNGAGKSTTIRHIMGFSKPDSGKTMIFGKDSFNHYYEILNRVGYIPGEIALPAGLTGYELFKLEPNVLKGETKRMSLGVKRKLAVVTAFMSDPDVLILDEPTSGLDPVMQEVFIKFIEEEKNRGKTILLSSHIFSEVDATCDRIGIIKDGKIVSEFNANDLKHASIKTYRLTFINKDEYLKFANNYSAKKYENIINVLEYNEEKNRVLVSVDDKNINKFISIVSEYSLDEFSNRKETLEDYFMKFYKEDKDFKGAL